ncbi:hypothetical protein BH10ACI3_BH10ACI3_18370 [soil metagenome]
MQRPLREKETAKAGNTNVDLGLSFISASSAVSALKTPIAFAGESLRIAGG